MDLKAPAVLSIAWLMAVLNGCHTAQGFGKDIENLGLLIQRELNQSAMQRCMMVVKGMLGKSLTLKK
ncbi:MAG: hypothetical protein KAG66_04845 [Methylococcales bacterium]|nr:hypothetical protein [Methylococcales bacterium]